MIDQCRSVWLYLCCSPAGARFHSASVQLLMYTSFVHKFLKLQFSLVYVGCLINTNKDFKAKNQRRTVILIYKFDNIFEIILAASESLEG